MSISRIVKNAVGICMIPLAVVFVHSCYRVVKDVKLMTDCLTDYCNDFAGRTTAPVEYEDVPEDEHWTH